MWDVFGNRALYGITKFFPNLVGSDVRGYCHFGNVMLKVLYVCFNGLPVGFVIQWYFPG